MESNQPTMANIFIPWDGWQILWRKDAISQLSSLLTRFEIMGDCSRHKLSGFSFLQSEGQYTCIHIYIVLHRLDSLVSLMKVGEREVYLTPAEPGCWHMPAGAAELSLSPACRSIHEAVSMYRPKEGFLSEDGCWLNLRIARIEKRACVHMYYYNT